MGGWAAGKGNFSYQTHSEWQNLTLAHFESLRLFVK